MWLMSDVNWESPEEREAYVRGEEEARDILINLALAHSVGQGSKESLKATIEDHIVVRKALSGGFTDAKLGAIAARAFRQRLKLALQHLE
jgi:hypothetical protein